MKNILLIGEPLYLLIANEIGELEDINTFYKMTAGAEVNVAVGLTRLGFDTQYATNLGNDPFGKSIYNFLKKENIGTEYINILNNEKTGLQLKAKTNVGDPKIYYYRSNSAATKFNIHDIEKIRFENIDLIHITGIPLAISKSFREAIFYTILKAKENNITITFDPNIRISMWDDLNDLKHTILEIAKYSDYFIPGINECEILVDSKDIDNIQKKLLSLGIKKIILKDGSNGSYYMDKDRKIFEPSFIVKKVVDTVGAGDGFAVGIISSILENLDINSMLIRANAIGARQVTNKSDNEFLPNRCELNEFINNNERKKI